jgi:hypothetical protein
LDFLCAPQREFDLGTRRFLRLLGECATTTTRRPIAVT